MRFHVEDSLAKPILDDCERSRTETPETTLDALTIRQVTSQIWTCAATTNRRVPSVERYEQPLPGYFENFLQEFRCRRRDELLWSIALEHLGLPRAGFCDPA
jgi:hypothetical protein